MEKMEIAQRLKNARLKTGLTQEEVAKKLGITYQAVSNYERGVNRIDVDTLINMCDVYNLSLPELLNSYYVCSYCDFAYSSDLKNDMKQHNLRHSKFEKAENHFGFMWNGNKRAKIKEVAYDVLHNDNASYDEKHEAAINLLKTYFCRSIENSDFDTSHDDFNDFALKSLNDGKYSSDISKDLYDDLLNEFKTKASNDYNNISNSYKPPHRIPILGRVAAGLPLYAEEHIIGYTYTERNGGAEYFGLLVDGDSMNATAILDGSVVIVRKQDNVDNGQIAVVLVDGEAATVKRYHRQGNTVTLMPQSTNPAHKLQVYNLRDTDISIIGKVVEVKNDIE